MMMKSVRSSSSGARGERRGGKGGGKGGEWGVAPLCLFPGAGPSLLGASAATSNSSVGVVRRRSTGGSSGSNSKDGSYSLLHPLATPTSLITGISSSSTELYPPGFVPTRTRGHLYVGSLLHALDESFISSSNVRFVVTAALPYGLWPQQQRLLYIRLGVDHTILPLLDSPQQAYLILFDNHSLASALETIRQHRPIARPNVGFLLQLQRLEQLAARKRWNMAPPLLMTPLPSAANSYDSSAASYSSLFPSSYSCASPPPPPPPGAPQPLSFVAATSSSVIESLVSAPAAAAAASRSSTPLVLSLQPSTTASASPSSFSDHRLSATATATTSVTSSTVAQAARTASSFSTGGEAGTVGPDDVSASEQHRSNSSSSCTSGNAAAGECVTLNTIKANHHLRNGRHEIAGDHLWSPRQRRNISADRRRGRSSSSSSSKEATSKSKLSTGRSSSACASLRTDVSGTQDDVFIRPATRRSSGEVTAAPSLAAVAVSQPVPPLPPPIIETSHAAAATPSPSAAVAAMHSTATVAGGAALVPPPGCFVPLHASSAALRSAAAASPARPFDPRPSTAAGAVAAGARVPSTATAALPVMTRSAAALSHPTGVLPTTPYAAPLLLLPSQQCNRLAPVSHCYNQEPSSHTATTGASSPLGALRAARPAAAASFNLSPTSRGLFVRGMTAAREAALATHAVVGAGGSATARGSTPAVREKEKLTFKAATRTAARSTLGMYRRPLGSRDLTLRDVLLQHAAAVAAVARNAAAAASVTTAAAPPTHVLTIGRSRTEADEKEVEKQIVSLQQSLTQCRYTTSRAR